MYDVVEAMFENGLDNGILCNSSDVVDKQRLVH